MVLMIIPPKRIDLLLRVLQNDIRGTRDRANRIYTGQFITHTKRCDNGFVRLQ